MTKEEFIQKWNVAFESKEQEAEFAEEMRSDLEQIVNERDDNDKRLWKIRFFTTLKQMRRRWLVQLVENKKLKDKNDALVTELFVANKRISELEIVNSRPAHELEGAEEVWNIAESILGRCKCDIAYASRRLTDPNCSWCEYHVDFIQSLHKFAAAKVEKVQSELEAARARISQLEELNKRLQFMVDNGLGDKDMKNDL